MFGGGIGIPELIIVLIILLLLFGPSRLGDLGSALGKGIRGFKRAMSEPDEIDVTPEKTDDKKPVGGSALETPPQTSEEKQKAGQK